MLASSGVAGALEKIVRAFDAVCLGRSLRLRLPSAKHSAYDGREVVLLRQTSCL